MKNKTVIKQKLLYLIIFINSILIFSSTFYCMISDNWVLVKPKRIVFINATTVLNEDEFYFMDLKSTYLDKKFKFYESINCKPLNGNIKFGLFKGSWFLNYAFGCRQKNSFESSKRIKIFQ